MAEFVPNSRSERRFAYSGFILLLLCIGSCLGFLGAPPAGYQLKPCNGSRYSTTQQSCCQGKLHDIPEDTHAQCCGDVAYWRNESKPFSCTVEGCGGRYHRETEICCDGRLVWLGRGLRHVDIACCGDSAINLRHFVCCGHTPLRSHIDSPLRCCGSDPFHEDTMTCNTSDQRVSLRRLHFWTTSILTEWESLSPLPSVFNDSHYHIRGLSETCGIKQTTSSRGSKIIIPLIPFFTGSEIDEECADAETVYLTIKVGRHSQAPRAVEDLSDSLRGRQVDVFFKHGLKCRKGKLSLRLKNKYNAVVFVSEPTMLGTTRIRDSKFYLTGRKNTVS